MLLSIAKPRRHSLLDILAEGLYITVDLFEILHDIRKQVRVLMQIMIICPSLLIAM